MPQATNFGSKLKGVDSSNIYLSLKAKNEKVRIRILKPPYYDGKHFQEVIDGSGHKTWHISQCPRVMDEAPCESCERYFEIMKPVRDMKSAMKKLSDSKEDKKLKAEYMVEIEEIQKKARPYKNTISFYYPVLNRDTAEAQIFKTVLSVRLAIDAEVEAGTDVLNTDFTVTRTEKTGSYYTVIKADSKDTPPLTDEEKDQIMSADGWKVGEIVGEVRESEQTLQTASTPSEVVNPDDIPV